MRQISIGASRYQRVSRENNDPGGPSRAERAHHPDPQALQHQIKQQRDDIERPIVAELPQRDQPCRVHRDHQRVMSRGDLDGAAGLQATGVIMRKNQFSGGLRRDEAEDEFRRAHAACRSETQLAVKPGPSAVNSERAGSPLARARSRMNNTVGDDMLPYSAITCRSNSSAP